MAQITNAGKRAILVGDWWLHPGDVRAVPDKMLPLLVAHNAVRVLALDNPAPPLAVGNGDAELSAELPEVASANTDTSRAAALLDAPSTQHTTTGEKSAPRALQRVAGGSARDARAGKPKGRNP